MRECCRQGQEEVVSNSSNKFTKPGDPLYFISTFDQNVYSPLPHCQRNINGQKPSTTSDTFDLEVWRLAAERVRQRLRLVAEPVRLRLAAVPRTRTAPRRVTGPYATSLPNNLSLILPNQVTPALAEKILKRKFKKSSQWLKESQGTYTYDVRKLFKLISPLPPLLYSSWYAPPAADCIRHMYLSLR